MKKNILLMAILMLPLIGCSSGSGKSYGMGEKLADKMFSQGIMINTNAMRTQENKKLLAKEMELVSNKKQFIAGFSDRGETILISQVRELNKKMGSTVLKEGDIKTMFDKKRNAYKE